MTEPALGPTRVLGDGRIGGADEGGAIRNRLWQAKHSTDSSARNADHGTWC